MIPLAKLKTIVQQGLRLAAHAKDIHGIEIFASSTGQLQCRLNYTSMIPCQGVEEPKSMETFGLGVRAVFAGSDGRRVGFASEARDLSLSALKRAIEKARQHAVPDPDFVSLPDRANDMARATKAASRSGVDRTLMELSDRALVQTGWQVIRQALSTFAEAQPLIQLSGSAGQVPALGLIVGGDVSVRRHRMAIASSRLPRVQADESTLVSSYVTAMIEQGAAKGSGYAVATHLAKFSGEAGAEAARNAIGALHGQRLPSGSYTVILGPQAVSDLLRNLVLPSLTADAFVASRSAFLGQVGRTVASDQLTVADHGSAKGLAGTKAMTCEGLPTGHTALISNGVLRGLLCNHYQSQRLQRDPQAREKLGVNPVDHPTLLTPRNGFRQSAMGSRQFEVPPSIAPTNVSIEGTVPHTLDSLLRLVGNGVYIGRIWYTYAINGLRAGDFSCTVVGDSYLIQDGRRGAAVRPNTIRITGNIRDLLRNILGISTQARPIVGWATDAIIYAPDVAVRDLHLSDIAHFMQDS